MTTSTASSSTPALSDPLTPIKGDGSVHSNADDTTDMSEDLSLDVAPPPPAENPFTKLFSFCSPKKEEQVKGHLQEEIEGEDETEASGAVTRGSVLFPEPAEEEQQPQQEGTMPEGSTATTMAAPEEVEVTLKSRALPEEDVKEEVEQVPSKYGIMFGIQAAVVAGVLVAQVVKFA